MRRRSLRVWVMQMPDATENQFLGALLGMAIGDALGAPLSGMNRTEIAARFGRDRPISWDASEPGR